MSAVCSSSGSCSPASPALAVWPFLALTGGAGSEAFSLIKSNQSVRDSPKISHPNRGVPARLGLCLSFPLPPSPLAVAAGQVCGCGPMGDASHSCIFCGVSTHFPPSFSSDCQENLGLAQTSCLPLAATTPPWISPCLSQPNQLPSLLLTHTQQLTQMNFPEQTFLFGGAQLGLRWVALGHMGGHRDACPASRSGSDP